MSLYPKKFENIITEEEISNFNNEELEDFYAANKIYVYTNGVIPEYINNFFTFFSYNSDLDVMKDTVTLNPDLIEEILGNFFEFLKFKNKDCNGLVKSLEYKLSFILSNNELIDELKKDYLYYSKKLQENGIVKNYLIPNSLDIYDKNLLSLLKIEISTQKSIVSNYITKETSIDFLSSKTLNSYKVAIEYTKAIGFIKEKLNNFQEIHIDIENKTAEKSLTLNQSIILFDKLRCLDDEFWLNLDKTKKVRIISILIGKNYDNIKKGLLLLERKPSEIPSQFIKDQEIISNLLNEILT